MHFHLMLLPVVIACLWGVCQSQEIVNRIPTRRQNPCNVTYPCPLQGGEYLVEPPQVFSNNGNLDFTLVVDVGDFVVDWMTLRRRMYNGSICGPTWNIRKGDSVKVRLINKLTWPDPNFGHFQQRFPNSTNLHTHGLHIGSEAPGDNVFVHVRPEQEFTYKYSIEAEQPSGTYWYHPHLHGSTLFQVHSGMAGFIIVEDEEADLSEQLKSVSCPFNCEHDVQLLFQPTLLYSNIPTRYQISAIQEEIGDLVEDLGRYNVSSGGTFRQWIENDNNGVDYFTTNGLIEPVLNMTTGQIKRFRMGNTGGGPLLEVELVDASSGQPACEVYEISLDGVYLNEARKPRLNKTFLMPSQRCDWLVMCDKPGTYVMRSNPAPEDEASFGPAVRWSGTLLTINVEGGENFTAIDTALPGRPSFIGDFQNVTDEEVGGRWILELSPAFGLNRERFTCEENYRYKMEENAIQEWQIVNTSPTIGHPIHIHVNHFQIINFQPYTGPVGNLDFDTLDWKLFSQNNQTCFYQHSNYDPADFIPFPETQYSGHYERWVAGGSGTLGYAQSGEFRDVVWVPPLSNITIRFLPDKFVGTVVIHCHFLNHEDIGMMLTTEIVPQGADLEAVIASGNSYPTTCDECDTYPFINMPDPCPASNTTITTELVNTTLNNEPTTHTGVTGVIETTSKATSNILSRLLCVVVSCMALLPML